MLVVSVRQFSEDRNETALFARRERRDDSSLCVLDGGHRAREKVASILRRMDELGSPVSVRHLAMGQTTPLQISNHDTYRRPIQRRQPTEVYLIDRSGLGEGREDRELKWCQIVFPAFLEEYRHCDLLTPPEEMTGHAADEIEYAVVRHVDAIRIDVVLSGMNLGAAGQVVWAHFDIPANPVLPYSHSSRS